MRRIAAPLGLVAIAAWVSLSLAAWAGDTCPLTGCKQVSACTACTPDAKCASCTAKADAAKKAPRFFGNATCPIMGGKINPKLSVAYADAKTHSYGKIYVCCAGCIEKVKKNPAAAYKKAYLDRELKDKDGKVIAKKGQPLDLKNAACPVMGGKVSPKHSLVYNGYKIGLCCPGCEKTFLKSPEKHLAKLLPKEKHGAQEHAAAHHLE